MLDVAFKCGEYYVRRSLQLDLLKYSAKTLIWKEGNIGYFRVEELIDSG